ncbi:GNAT family N-acetyltransferase [Pacificimonas pallii]|nr:GNAT family N-acetyltransferase [Pacificimonas pallii]
MPLSIVQDNLSGREIRALLEVHLDEMHRNSPACLVHAMPAERLQAPDVTFWSAWSGDALAGCGALKEIGARHGELKSMRTAPAFLRQGVAEAILLHLMAEARARGYRRLSLETGRTAPFHPAHALYRKHGFTDCAPFADYAENDFSMCMTRVI